MLLISFPQPLASKTFPTDVIKTRNSFLTVFGDANSRWKYPAAATSPVFSFFFPSHILLAAY